MEIVSKIDAACRVTAALDLDTKAFSVNVFGQAEYAPGRTTTAQVPTEDIPVDLQRSLKVVLEEIGKFAEHSLGSRVQTAVHKSVEVGVQMGEL